MSQRREYYVYVHQDSDGNVFYVGKGTGRRAWSTERHFVWHRYVSERLKGEYEVVIERSDLTENEAEELEWKLIEAYSSQLVNWVKPDRPFDFTASEKYNRLRDANLRFVDETKAFERSDPDRAVRCYRQALKQMRRYESMVTERGLIADLMKGTATGDTIILDRLTLCLVRSGRATEAVAEAERYFAGFPAARNLVIGQNIVRRVERAKRKHEEKLGGER